MQVWIRRITLLVAAVALMSLPVAAQRGNNGDAQRGAHPQGRASQGRQSPGRQPQGRGQAAPRRPDAGQRRGGQQAQGPRAVPRQPSPPHAGSRRGVPPPAVAVPRGRVLGPHGGRAYPEPRFYGYARPRATVPIIVYPRSYYVFRPRFGIGFGLFVGMPVPYPLMFGYPSYIYGYPAYYPPPPEAPPPAESLYGGVSFDITPADASVSVDGVYVGIANDFSPTHQPLTLTPGRHHIELQAEDMIPLAFDVDVVAGQVIPYRGALQPR